MELRTETEPSCFDSAAEENLYGGFTSVVNHQAPFGVGREDIGWESGQVYTTRYGSS